MTRPLFRLHRDEYESTYMLDRPELEYAIVDGDQRDNQALYVHGMNCLYAWYAGQSGNVIHKRHDSYMNNPLKGRQFTPPWWWNNPLYIENCRAILLYNKWHTYKDNQHLSHYIKPKAEVPFIKPHETKANLWHSPNGLVLSELDLWKALGWVAEVEDPATRRNRVLGRQ